MPTKKELAKLGNYYFYLLIAGSFCFFMVNPPNPTSMYLGSNLIEAGKQSVQSMIVDPYIKQAVMFFLLMYTTFVAVESLAVVRNCLGRLYYKSKGINVIE